MDNILTQYCLREAPCERKGKIVKVKIQNKDGRIEKRKTQTCGNCDIPKRCKYRVDSIEKAFLF